MWRQELAHPLLVHFPIALLWVGTIFLLLHFVFAKRKRAGFLLPAGRTLLWSGAALAWIAVYTGELAENVVNRVVCDPTATHEHGDQGEWTAWIFTGAALFEAIRAGFEAKSREIRWLAPFVLLLALIGSVSLLRTGHSGASLVYQQGAAVYHPTPECREFE